MPIETRSSEKESVPRNWFTAVLLGGSETENEMRRSTAAQDERDDELRWDLATDVCSWKCDLAERE